MGQFILNTHQKPSFGQKEWCSKVPFQPGTGVLNVFMVKFCRHPGRVMSYVR